MAKMEFLRKEGGLDLPYSLHFWPALLLSRSSVCRLRKRHSNCCHCYGIYEILPLAPQSLNLF